MSSFQSMLRPVMTVLSSPTYRVRVHIAALSCCPKGARRVAVDSVRPVCQPQSSGFFCSHLERGKGPLAFDFEFTQRVALKSAGDFVPDVLGECDAALASLTRHPRGDVDRVAPDIELVALLSNYA